MGGWFVCGSCGGWMEVVRDKDGKIKVVFCPRCETPPTRTQAELNKRMNREAK